jgi:hypothetical protein
LQRARATGPQFRTSVKQLRLDGLGIAAEYPFTSGIHAQWPDFL